MAKIPAILSEKIVFKGWSTFSVYEIAVPDAAGKLVTHTREVGDHGNAAAILLLHPEKRVTTLVRQFRLGAHLGAGDSVLLEACAGLLEGEDPQHCAEREAIEKAGIMPPALSSTPSTSMPAPAR